MKLNKLSQLKKNLMQLPQLLEKPPLKLERPLMMPRLLMKPLQLPQMMMTSRPLLMRPIMMLLTITPLPLRLLLTMLRPLLLQRRTPELLLVELLLPSSLLEESFTTRESQMKITREDKRKTRSCSETPSRETLSRRFKRRLSSQPSLYQLRRTSEN